MNELLPCPFCNQVERPFRVMNESFPGAPCFVPWGLVEPHESSAQRNHSQSLQRLHERGGLDVGELLAVLENRRWEHITDTKAAAEKLNAYVDAYRKRQLEARKHISPAPSAAIQPNESEVGR